MTAKGMLIAGLKESTTEQQAPVKLEETPQAMRVALLVWDSVALDWVKMEQPSLEFSGDLTASFGDVERLLIGNYFNDVRYEYTGDELIYIGYNVVHKAAEAATTWVIFKLSYTSGNLVRKEGPLVGSWTDKGALAWA